MEQAAVAAAIARLEAQGKAPSLGNIRTQLGGGSWRDITQWRRALLSIGDAREEEVSMALEGMLSLSDPVLPRPPQDVAPVEAVGVIR
jgi:hypothetical protein